MKVKYYLAKSFQAVETYLNDWAVSLKGQENNYAILQTSHRIEKGLTIQNPRKLWGWNKVDNLVELISIEMKKEHPDQFAIETGVAVLKAYADYKEKCGEEERIKARNLFTGYDDVKKLVENCKPVGGTIKLSRDEIVSEDNAEAAEKLFHTRHSVRDFDSKEVSRETLNKAIQLALYSPSACNRQPTKIYVLSAKRREELGFENIYNANQYLILTGEMNAFTAAEHGDWVVSTSIFAGYLVLALHSMGIGSCIKRKEMTFHNKYNSIIRKECGIPKNEKIILEIPIGYYHDEIIAAYSNRKKAEDVVSYIQ